MKKFFAIAVCLVFAASTIFVSCEKDGNDVATTTVTCQDSVYAWLLADSIVCSGKNFFRIPLTATTFKLVAVDLGITAIDTIVGNAGFNIAFDSLPGTTPCKGAVYQNASVVCFTRK
jgi:hypothetical protein